MAVCLAAAPAAAAPGTLLAAELGRSGAVPQQPQPERYSFADAASLDALSRQQHAASASAAAQSYGSAAAPAGRCLFWTFSILWVSSSLILYMRNISAFSFFVYLKQNQTMRAPIHSRVWQGSDHVCRAVRAVVCLFIVRAVRRARGRRSTWAP